MLPMLAGFPCGNRHLPMVMLSQCLVTGDRPRLRVSSRLSSGSLRSIHTNAFRGLVEYGVVIMYTRNSRSSPGCSPQQDHILHHVPVRTTRVFYRAHH